MVIDRIDEESNAVQSLAALYEQARQCRDLYQRAQMGLPEALQRFFGMNGNSHKAAGKGANIPPLPRLNPPEEAGHDWLWIDVTQAGATSIVLAVLRANKEPLHPRDIFERVTRYLADCTSGSISNIGTRLDGTVIERTDDGWKLLQPEKAGIIRDGRLWGPASVFSKTELAVHRRDAILHLLHALGGLQIVQIVEQLRNCNWVNAPVNKDLVKADMAILLAAGKVRRVGNSKKWAIAEGSHQ